MHVAQVSCYLDPLARRSAELLTAWFTLRDVAAAVASTGIEVTVIQAAAYDETLEHNGVTFHFVGERTVSLLRRRLGGWGAALPRNIAARIAARRPDVLHLHSLSFPLHARYLTNRFRALPVLVQDHADRPPPLWRRSLHRYGLAGVAGVAFTAREQAAPFFDGGVLRRDLPVFEVPESSSHFTPGDQTRARAATGLFGDPCLLSLAHLNTNKDPLTVFEALSRAAPDLPDPHLWCCFRDAPLLERVKARIGRDPLITDRVHLLGPRPHPEVEQLLRAADFLVSGSHREGSGYAVIEALACGTTPLVTDIPSFRRLTADGAVGALSPPGDAHAMARALVEWTRRDRAALRAASRAHFEDALSFKVIGAQLGAAYTALLAPQ
jgi:glycosyltransferase involved in cell wall biosynthesis